MNTPPDRLVAIDPGVLNLGWALFEHGRLSRCGLSQASSPVEHAGNIAALYRPDVVVLEKMTVRDIPNALDLLNVTETGAFVAGSLLPAFLYSATPSRWKGNVPKLIHHARLARVLTEGEHAVAFADVEPIRASLQHNVWDAIGLGLWGLGRK
jgi:hypothetical protein